MLPAGKPVKLWGNYNILMQFDLNLKQIKLENCVCKTQSISPCCACPSAHPTPIIIPLTLFFSKKQVQTFNQSASIVKSFGLIAFNLCMKLIIQTCHPVLTLTQKLSKFEKAIFLSKVIFSLSKTQLHVFNVSATTVQSFRLIA